MVYGFKAIGGLIVLQKHLAAERRRRRLLALPLLAIPIASGWAQEAGRLEEIIVTAEFREGNVQDTPISITAVTGDMLEARSQTNIVEVSAQAPNVTLTPSGHSDGSAMIAFIRGIGQVDFNYALEPGVGIYVDEIYYPNLTGSMVELLDLERVEILRGPQGTLAGRNAIGGTIKLFSREPDLDANSGSAQVSFGDYDRVDLRGNADFTLIEDRLAMRIAGASTTQDGYVDRLDYRCVHPTSDIPSFSNGALDDCSLGTLGGKSFTGGRATLLWSPTDRFELKVIADTTNENNESGAQILLGVNEVTNSPGPAGNGQVVNGVPEGTYIDVDGDLSTTADREYYDNRFVTWGPNRGDPVIDSPYVSYATFFDPMPSQPNRPFSPVNVDPGIRFEQRGISVQLDWDVGDASTLTYITAAREYTDNWAQDTDHSPMNNQMLTQEVRHEHSTHEIRWSGVGWNDRLDYTLGYFLADQNKAEHIANVNLYYAQINFIHGPDITPSDSEAIFGHVTFGLSDTVNLSLGSRYTEDTKDYRFRRRNPDGTIPLPCPGPPPIGNINYPPNCALAGLDLVSDHFESDSTDYRLALDWQASDNVMLYGQFATGYKGGGINPRPFFPIQVETFQPEELDSIEFGLKSQIGDLRLNAAIFQSDYQDIQQEQGACEVPFPPFFSGPCLQPANVGDADIEGIELELDYAPTDNLRIDASVATLDFQYTRIASNVATTIDMIAPYTPETTWHVGIQYDIPLQTGGELSLRLDSSYHDDIFTDSVNAPTNMIDDYTLSNARIMWRAASLDWEAALEVTNLTDEVYFVNIFDQFDNSTAGQLAGGIGAPRMWALHLKRNFDF